MDFRYSRWDERLTQNLNFLRHLLSLYHRLLLMTDGKVDQALRALEELGERFGFFNEKFTIEDFKKQLREKDAIREVNGRTVMTKAGERMIRKDSLDRIFGDLAKDSAGEHRVPRTGAVSGWSATRRLSTSGLSRRSTRPMRCMRRTGFQCRS